MQATAAALAAYALGLPAYVLIKVLTPSFYAREDTRTPVKIAVVCVVVNSVVAFTLMQFFAHVGIALATVASAWLNCLMLAFMLRRRGYFAPDRQLKRRVPRVIVSTLVMAAVLWGTERLMGEWLMESGPKRLMSLVVLVVVGLAVYAIAALLTGAADLKEARRLVGRPVDRGPPKPP